MLYSRQIIQLILNIQYLYFSNTHSCSMGNVVASYAEGYQLDSRQRLHRFLLCKWHSEDTALLSCEWYRPVKGSLTPLSHSWLWSTATRGCSLYYFRSIIGVVHNLPHKEWQQIFFWGTPVHKRLYIFTFSTYCSQAKL